MPNQLFTGALRLRNSGLVAVDFFWQCSTWLW